MQSYYFWYINVLGFWLLQPTGEEKQKVNEAIKLAFVVYYKPQASCIVSIISLLNKRGSFKRKKGEKSNSRGIKRKKRKKLSSTRNT